MVLWRLPVPLPFLQQQNAKWEILKWRFRKIQPFNHHFSRKFYIWWYMNTVPNLQFSYKNSTLGKTCKKWFDKRFWILTKKKNRRIFEFSLENWSKKFFSMFCWSIFWVKSRFLTLFRPNIQEYLTILAQKFKVFEK